MSTQIVLTETGWLAVYKDDITELWVSLKYDSEPTVAQVEADGIAALTPPDDGIEVECKDGTVVP